MWGMATDNETVYDPGNFWCSYGCFVVPLKVEHKPVRSPIGVMTAFMGVIVMGPFALGAGSSW